MPGNCHRPLRRPGRRYSTNRARGHCRALGRGAAAIAVLPFTDTILVQNHETGHINLALGSLVWRTSGAIILLIAGGCCGMLLFRRRGRRPLRWSADSLFVVGWVLLEIAGYFALTPFPAARRVFGVTFALGILAARAVSRTQGMPGRRPPRWVVPFGIAAGVLVAALDTFDAFPEKDLAERAAAATQAASPEERVWFIGHWGFQYYCERAGMVPAIPGQSVFEPGDWFVRPLYPDDGRFFFRPYAGGVELMPPDDSCELVEVFVWDDWLSATTIPNYYGGTEPVLGRNHPRSRRHLSHRQGMAYCALIQIHHKGTKSTQRELRRGDSKHLSPRIARIARISKSRSRDLEPCFFSVHFV